MSWIEIHRSEGEKGRRGDTGTRRRGDGVFLRRVTASLHRHVLCWLLVAGYCLLLSACQPAPPPTLPPLTPSPPLVTLHIGLDEGAAAIIPLLPVPPIPIEWVLANNVTLLEDLNAGQVDAILTHVIPPDDDRWFNPVALDGLVIMVHPDNPVTALTLAEIQAIFSGKINNWAEVGGADNPIVLVSRERGSGARAIFNERVMGAQRLAITALVAPDQVEMMSEVGENAAAIGYGMMSGLSDEVRPLTIDGYFPNPATTASQNYPLTVPLYFLAPTADEPQGELRAFLAWLQSPETQISLSEKIGSAR